jgi:methyl-accepting chemotaxis protein
MGGEEDDYEVIPTSPIRRLERRLSKVESSSSASEVSRLIEQIIELIKSNQRVIDDVIKADAELRNEVSKIPGKIDELLSGMTEFLDLPKMSATENTVSEISKDVMDPLVKKMGEMVEEAKRSGELQQASLTSLSMIDKRLKRLYLQSTGTAQSYSREGEI